MVWACPREEAAGSGFSFQSFAKRQQKDFHCNPSRGFIVKIHSYGHCK